jgi:hypothetical protein
MDLHRIRALAKLLAALLAWGSFVPAHAGTLYKAIAANGTVIFSDVPPPADARIVEQRAIPSYGGPNSSAGLPYVPGATPLDLIESDAAVQRANAAVDQAEHELALARRNTWSAHEGLKLVSTRATLSDAERVEFYKRNLRSARQYLVELLRERQSPQPARPPQGGGEGRVILSAASY